MKKVIRINGLDCANCAAELECALKRIDGVTDASVGFLTQKIVYTCDDARADEVREKVLAVIHRQQPRCRLLV